MPPTAELVKETGTTTVDAGGVVGVFLGVSYTNPTTKQWLQAQYWPANTVASDAFAYVADDPDQLFKVVLVTGTTADDATSGLLPAYLGRTIIGSNAQLVQNAGSSVTGDSKVGIYTAAGATTTDTLPIRIIDVVPDTANSLGNFCELIVKWNAPNVTGQTVANGHQYLNPTGV